MIHNDEELKIAEQQYNNLQDAYGQMKIFQNKHPLDQLSALSMNALKAQADELLIKISEYKNLISSPLPVKAIASLRELRSFIVKDRISQHISQDAMAKHLAIAPSTYRKLEATNFDGAPFSLLKKAASFLDLPYAANIFDSPLDPSKVDIDKLSTSEMSRRGWLDGLIPAG
ncbi:hypothetical protein IQ277_34675 [Nostocales cyanobacterium LEGE 12452]|nr:hypothetical protein [Nostocales cyanobacterium LEGE 12452]